MNPLAYLTLTKFKNQLKSFVRSPAKLIYAAIMAALLVFVVLSGNMGGGETAEYRGLSELAAIVTAFYTLMFLLTAYSGFSTGMSVFRMPDVNFLFAGPFRPMRVLFYGMCQQLATALLMGFVILFQYAWMHDSYGVGVLQLVYILIGYSLTVFTSQLVAMFIYMMTSGRAKRRKLFLAAFIAVPAVYAVWLFASVAFGGADTLPTLIAEANSLAVRLFPVSGWLGGAVGGALRGDWAASALGLAVWAAVIVLAVAVMMRTDQDYYEDVLQSTETAFLNAESAKKGRVAESAPQNVKTGATGLGGGTGAAAFWYKHRVENRRSRRFILSGTELLFAVISVGFAYLMRSAGGLAAAIGFAEYMQVFSVSLGRLNRELTKPYVYLVPEPPFRKLLWCLRESLTGFAVGAVLIYVPVCLMNGLGAPEMAACVVMHISFSLLFVAANLITERIFGAVNTKALMMMFYFFVMLVLAAPGVVLAVIAWGSGLMLYSAETTICLVMAVCNLLIAAVCIFLCRNILAYAELR